MMSALLFLDSPNIRAGTVRFAISHHEPFNILPTYLLFSRRIYIHTHTHINVCMTIFKSFNEFVVLFSDCVSICVVYNAPPHGKLHLFKAVLLSADIKTALVKHFIINLIVVVILQL